MVWNLLLQRLILTQMEVSVSLKIKTKESGIDPMHECIHILPQTL